MQEHNLKKIQKALEYLPPHSSLRMTLLVGQTSFQCLINQFENAKVSSRAEFR